MQLEAVAPGIVTRLQRLALIADTEKAVLAALEAKAGAGGANIGTALATFTGMYRPTLLILPPAALAGAVPNLAGYQAAGITIVLAPTSTKALLVDPNAVCGWLVCMSLTRTEPAVFGRQYGEGVYGKVGINPAGVVTYTTP